MLDVLYNPERLQIIGLIHAKGRTNVSSIYKKLKVRQSVMSLQLRFLREAGFLIAERKGKFIFYSLNYERFREVDTLVNQLLQ